MPARACSPGSLEAEQEYPKSEDSLDYITNSMLVCATYKGRVRDRKGGGNGRKPLKEKRT